MCHEARGGRELGAGGNYIEQVDLMENQKGKGREGCRRTDGGRGDAAAERKKTQKVTKPLQIANLQL